MFSQRLVLANFSLAFLAVFSVLVSSCQPSQSKKTTTTIKIDGSDTVYPITQEVSNDYNFQKNNGKSPSVKAIELDSSGTSSGFKKFCLGETDINDASRPIHTHEIKDCQQNHLAFLELPIGFDAITIVVNSQNNWAQDITLAELKKIWEPSAEGKITTWHQIRLTWPNKPLTDQAYRLNNIHFNKGKVGTVFEGKSQFNLTLEQVLQKQGKF